MRTEDIAKVLGVSRATIWAYAIAIDYQPSVPLVEARIENADWGVSLPKSRDRFAC